MGSAPAGPFGHQGRGAASLLCRDGGAHRAQEQGFMDSIEADLLEAIRLKFGGNPRPSDSLVAIGVDSLGMAEFSAEIEARFGVRVEEDVLGVETVSDLVDYIRTKKA